jgi:hypothetical protein
MGGLPALVWNKGIAARCDRRIPDEFPDGRTYVHVPTLAGGNVVRSDWWIERMRHGAA